MILIVGLGNPGKKYEKTRHNIGFRIIDSLDFARDKGVILLKPQTFMNNSGKAIKPLITKYKLQSTQLWVIHDDIDLPMGTIRISKNSSSGGHKGVQSIINETGTKNFIRFRIGIRPKFKVDTEKFVLKKFTKQEEKNIKKIIEKITGLILESLKNGIKTTTITI
jgi:PTH1 family peptidyl-tRNA hydrolase